METTFVSLSEFLGEETSNRILGSIKRLEINNNIKEWIKENIKKFFDEQGKEQFKYLYDAGFFENEFEEYLMDEWNDDEYLDVSEEIEDFIDDEVIKYL